MPTLHFAHANGFPSPTYAPFFEALQQHGHSIDYIEKIAHNPQYPITNNWPHLIDELEHNITQKHQQPIIGIGHSAGGLLHFLLAQRRPALYSHLILLDPPVINGWQGIIWWLVKRLRQTDRFTPAQFSKNRRTHFSDYAAAGVHLRSKSLFKHFTADAFNAYLQHGLTETAQGDLTLAFDKDKELALFRTAADDLWRYRRRFTMPGLYLTGEHSEFARLPFAQRLTQKHGMTYQVVTGGHLFPQEHPQATAEVINNWLQQPPNLR